MRNAAFSLWGRYVELPVQTWTTPLRNNWVEKVAIIAGKFNLLINTPLKAPIAAHTITGTIKANTVE